MPAQQKLGDLAKLGALAEATMLLAVVKLMDFGLSFVTKAVKATETSHPQASNYFCDCVCTSRASW